MNKDLEDSIQLIGNRAIQEYTKERFLAEEEYEDLKQECYNAFIELSKEGKLTIKRDKECLTIKIPLQP